MVIFMVNNMINIKIKMGKVYKFSDIEVEEMIKMYIVDMIPIYKIALKYNVDYSVIKLRLNDNGVTIINGSPYNVNYWISRGKTKEEAITHIKTLRPVNKEYWINLGYSGDDAILQVEGQKLTSLRGCKAKYGNIEGEKIWFEREELRSINGKMGSTNTQYWVKKGYSESDAKLKVSERQSTFTKQKCIDKYGEIEGLKRFIERQNKWQKELYKGGKLKSGYSEISQELFYKISEIYDINDLPYILFAKKNGEFVLNNNISFFRYDFTDIKNKKIIEYNGDDYHGNPNKYSELDTPNPFRRELLAKDIWEKDIIKKKLANENGFNVLVIWDSEYKKNKEEIINKCIKFLKCL
jgi:very-short-patch-repair endonuclease